MKTQQMFQLSNIINTSCFSKFGGYVSCTLRDDLIHTVRHITAAVKLFYSVYLFIYLFLHILPKK